MSNDQFKVDFGCTLDARPIADCLDNKFYVIPSYQRGFKWGPSQVNTLLKEIVTYYNRCLSHESDNAPARVNAKFIGTIITVEMPDDAKRKMVEYTIAVPPNLRHVIDGQQRLTVLTLVTICFLRRFELLWKKFDEKHFSNLGVGNAKDKSDWYRKFIEASFLEHIQNCIGVNSATSGFSPSLTREHKDKVCSKKSDSFNTVTAELAYKEFMRSRQIIEKQSCDDLNESNVRVFSPDNEYCFLKNDFNENFRSTIDIIDDFLDVFCGRPEPSKTECTAFVDIRHFDITVYWERISKTRKQKIDYHTNDHLAKEFFSLITLWDFITSYVFLASVECPNENALDIFESLNTAGRSLTTIETFIPDVHRYYDSLDVAPQTTNNSNQNLTLIEQASIPFEFVNGTATATSKEKSSMLDWLNHLRLHCENDSDTDNKAAAETVISFAAIYAGYPLETTPSQQRFFLKAWFKTANDSDANIFHRREYSFSKPSTDFIIVLTMVSEWWLLAHGNFDDTESRIFSFDFHPQKHFNNLSKEQLLEKRTDFEDLEDQAILAMKMLLAGKFTLPLSIACRFWIEYRYANTVQSRYKSYIEFLNALRALAAFASIWISKFGATAGIEDAFRRIFTGCNNIEGAPKFDGFSFDKHTVPTTTTLKPILRWLLANKHNGTFTLNTWIKGLKKNKPAKRKEITRYLNLAYWHNTIKSESSHGLRDLITRPTDGTSDFLSSAKWDIYSTYDLEHILPQTPNAAWKTAVPDYDEELIQSLGNTTLLPKGINRFLQNNGWEHKQKGYNVLCVLTQNEIDDFVATLPSGLKPKSFRSKIKNTTAQTNIAELADPELRVWDHKFIDERTARMATVIWTNLKDYLGLPPADSPDANIYDDADQP